MEKTLLDALLSHNMEKVCQEMILPSRDFVGGNYPYEVDLKSEALDEENFIVRTDKWMNTMLSFDDFTDMVNHFIYGYEKREGSVFDYVMVDELIEHGLDIRKEISGYTYNDPDHCRLDRDIHYSIFSYDGDYYAIFSVHYGADARAGFSDIACFKIDDFDYFFIGMEVSVYNEKTDEDVQWYEVEDIAEYIEGEGWIVTETGDRLSVYTSADGY